MEREFENNSNPCKTYTLAISIKSNKSMEPELLINGGRKPNRMLSFRQPCEGHRGHFLAFRGGNGYEGKGRMWVESPGNTEGCLSHEALGGLSHVSQRAGMKLKHSQTKQSRFPSTSSCPRNGPQSILSIQCYIVSVGIPRTSHHLRKHRTEACPLHAYMGRSMDQ